LLCYQLFRVSESKRRMPNWQFEIFHGCLAVCGLFIRRYVTFAF
jgi:hypothetical protein